MMNKFQAIHLSNHGFTLIKEVAQRHLIFHTYKNASFTTLQRECGVFFDKGPNAEIPVLLSPCAPVLVPKALYEPPALPYLSAQIALTDNDAVLENEIGDYVALFPFPQMKLIQLQTFGFRPLFHHVDEFLYRYLLHETTAAASKMVLFFTGNKADIVLLQQGALQLVNVISFTTAYDLLYFVLNILHQFDCTLEQTIVLLAGTFPDSKKTFQLLAQYIPYVQWADDVEDCIVEDTNGVRYGASVCLPALSLYAINE